MELYNVDTFLHAARLILLLLVGLPTVLFITSIIKRILSQKASAHVAMLIANIIFYLGLAIIGISLVQELGFNISALLGAAGVVGIAIGFAAKTTVANIISGIFLLLEHPFVVGDRITCAGSSGIVESIDLMSVKLRTINGQLVRIPNEILIGQSMTNISFYPKLRVVFKAEIQPGQDIQAIMNFLQKTIDEEPAILTDPKPLVTIKGYSQYAVDIMLRFWVKQKDIKIIYQKLAEKTQNYGQEKDIWIGLTQEN